MPIKVCHVTSVHKPTDARIFEHECTSLAQYYDVTLIAPNVDDYERNGVHVKGVKLPTSRLGRQRSLGKVFEAMKEVDADLYHFHDPELIPIGLKIKELGKKVVFDSHENVPAQILNKKYIPTSFVRHFVSKLYAFYEKKSLRRFDGLVSVTPEIVDRLKSINPNTIMLTNYPVYSENMPERKWERKIGFTGGVLPVWNIHNIIKAIEDLDVVFELAGPVNNAYLDSLKQLPGWNKVNYHGVIKYSDVFPLLSKCTVGMAVGVSNDPNGGGKKGTIGVTKMFEYMLAGIPVLSSDLDLWKPIIEGNNCGLCVSGDSVKQIKEKIVFFLSHPEVSKEMGDNGRKAIKEKYSWQSQEVELFGLYNKILRS